MLVPRDEGVEIERAVGVQIAQRLIGEGKRKSRGNIGLRGDRQEGREGTEKNLGLEVGVSKSETDGRDAVNRVGGTPEIGGTPVNRVWMEIAEEGQN